MEQQQTQTRTPIDDLQLQELRQHMERASAFAAALHASAREALYMLMRTGSFSEQDLQMMFRAQALAADCDDHPCEEGPSEDEDESPSRSEGQLRFRVPLDPAPLARNRLLCPLYERGRKGDPLVPCYWAQCANPAVQKMGPLKEAPFLPGDLPADRREAINYFFQPGVASYLSPCRALHKLTAHHLAREVPAPGPLYQVTTRPSPQVPAPPPECGDMELRRLLKQRETALADEARLEAAQEYQRRRLLLYLCDTGRLTSGDLSTMADRMAMVTDTGWLPCRDDPRRTAWFSSARQDAANETDDEEMDGTPLRRYLCPLQERAKLGDRTVPCVEAQEVAPVPAMIAEERAYTRRAQAEMKAEGITPRADPVPPRSWVGPEDAPGGPGDIVKRLNIRPCYLFGRTAASYLYDLGQYLLAHPETIHGDEDEDEDEEGGPEEAPPGR